MGHSNVPWSILCFPLQPTPLLTNQLVISPQDLHSLHPIPLLPSPCAGLLHIVLTNHSIKVCTFNQGLHNILTEVSWLCTDDFLGSRILMPLRFTLWSRISHITSSTYTPPPSSLTPPATTEFTDSNTFLPRKDIVNAACLCFGSVSAVPLVSSSSSEWKSSSAMEGGANLAVSIGTTNSCKCRRKRRFVFYAFLWTCRETVKSQALKIVYRAYAGALKGW